MTEPRTSREALTPEELIAEWRHMATSGRDWLGAGDVLNQLEAGMLIRCASQLEAALRVKPPSSAATCEVCKRDGHTGADCPWQYTDAPSAGDGETPAARPAPRHAHSKSEYRRITAQGGRILPPKETA